MTTETIMSIKQKAKAYDEALERAKKQLEEAKVFDYKEGQIAHDIRTTTYAIFPELKEENEDERIRMALCDIVRDMPYIETELRAHGLTVEKTVAWLEKQKINTEGDFGRGYDCGYKACLNSHGAEFFEKQKEQKPVEDWREKRKKECPFRIADGCKQYASVISECTGACSWVVDYPKLKEIQDKRERKPAEYLSKEKVFAIMNKLTSLSFCVPLGSDEEKKIHEITCDVSSLLDYPIEQKPAEWSEEDRRKLNRIYDILGYAADDKGFLTSKRIIGDKEAIELQDFLKSLRPQPKKELSIEKAIKWLDDTFYFLDNSSGRGRDCEITTHDFDSLEEMYDSFRKAVIVDSEPHWKPSEEQMTTLLRAEGVVRVHDTKELAAAIARLYEQLKKLM